MGFFKHLKLDYVDGTQNSKLVSKCQLDNFAAILEALVLYIQV
jgi:hypothetical protein